MAVSATVHCTQICDGRRRFGLGGRRIGLPREGEMYAAGTAHCARWVGLPLKAQKDLPCCHVCVRKHNRALDGLARLALAAEMLEMQISDAQGVLLPSRVPVRARARVKRLDGHPARGEHVLHVVEVEAQIRLESRLQAGLRHRRILVHPGNSHTDERRW